MRSVGRGLLILLVTLVLVTAACGDSGSDSSVSEEMALASDPADSDSGASGSFSEEASADEDIAAGGEFEDEAAPSAADSDGAEGAAPESVSGQPVVNAALQPTDIGRDLIFTGASDLSGV